MLLRWQAKWVKIIIKNLKQMTETFKNWYQHNGQKNVGGGKLVEQICTGHGDGQTSTIPYEEALNEFRWVDEKVSQQAWLVQDGQEYVGKRRGAFDVPVTKWQGKELTWVPIRKEWRDGTSVKPKYF